MLIRDLQKCTEFIAGDKTILREILHPDKAGIDTGYSLAHARVKQGESSLPHRLKTSEVYYILEGKGVMHIDNESSEIKKDQAVYIPPGAVQYVENKGEGELVFLCIVDPAWKPENEEVF